MSGTRTYIPTLVRVLKWTCQYIVKHRSKIQEVVGTGAQAALDGIMTACEIFLALVDEFV